MTDRILEIVDRAASLSLNNGRLKIKMPDRADVFLPVSEIGCLILTNPAVTVTGALLASLALAGCMVVVSDGHCLPVAMQLPLDANYIQNERFRRQIAAPLPLKKQLWRAIVKAKIIQQAKNLKRFCGEDSGLSLLAERVKSGDIENMESRAAVIYWRNLFKKPFLRDRNAADNNALLNYGYTVLRAMTARYCCAAGLHPAIGLHHHNRYDPYCLADDLMEPFRPAMDAAVRELNPGNLPIPELTGDLRRELLSVLFSRIQTERGQWQIGDLLQETAERTARSFSDGKMELTFDFVC